MQNFKIMKHHPLHSRQLLKWWFTVKMKKFSSISLWRIFDAVVFTTSKTVELSHSGWLPTHYMRNEQFRKIMTSWINGYQTFKPVLGPLYCSKTHFKPNIVPISFFSSFQRHHPKGSTTSQSQDMSNFCRKIFCKILDFRF